MKKVAILLALVLAFSCLTACGSSQTEVTRPAPEVQAPVMTLPPVPETEAPTESEHLGPEGYENVEIAWNGKSVTVCYDPAVLVVQNVSSTGESVQFSEAEGWDGFIICNIAISGRSTAEEYFDEILQSYQEDPFYEDCVMTVERSNDGRFNWVKATFNFNRRIPDMGNEKRDFTTEEILAMPYTMEPGYSATEMIELEGGVLIKPGFYMGGQDVPLAAMELIVNE